MIRLASGELSESLKARLGIKARRKPRELEHFEQVRLIAWVREQERTFPAFSLLYAIPNGGKRSKAVAGKQKAEGVLAGAPDIAWPYPSREFKGLYMEMKADGGSLRPNQKRFLTAVALNGYCAAVAYGADEGIAVLKWYAELSEEKPQGIIDL